MVNRRRARSMAIRRGVCCLHIRLRLDFHARGGSWTLVKSHGGCPGTGSVEFRGRLGLQGQRRYGGWGSIWGSRCCQWRRLCHVRSLSGLFHRCQQSNGGGAMAGGRVQLVVVRRQTIIGRYVGATMAVHCHAMPVGGCLSFGMLLELELEPDPSQAACTTSNQIKSDVRRDTIPPMRRCGVLRGR